MYRNTHCLISPSSVASQALHYGERRVQAGQTVVGTSRRPTPALTIWVHGGGSASFVVAALLLHTPHGFTPRRMAFALYSVAWDGVRLV